MKLLEKLLILLIFFHFGICLSNKQYTIMLNPAGDAKDAGRMLQDSFERGLTLQFAKELKNNLELTYPNLRIVLTRIPGETLEPLQNANFSNRLNADLYLSIHFYKEKELIPKVFLYHYLTNPFSIKSSINLFFYNFDTAHLINISKTIEYAQIFQNNFKNNIDKNKFNFKGIFGIPFKPLIGIKAPSLAIEIGLKNINDFFIYTQIIIESIGQIFK